MSRTFRVSTWIGLLVTGAILLAPATRADDPPAADSAPQIAADEDAAAALAAFHTAWKESRRLKGDDRMAQRDWAMSELSKTEHPKVVDALAKVSRSSDETLRILAVIYLGEETALPGLAGPHIVRVLERYGKDAVVTLTCLQSLGHLKYLGATKEIADRLDDKDFAVKKAAIVAVGEIGEMRLWKEVLKLAGIEVKTTDASDSSGGDGKEEVVDQGYSYDGVEVTYDTGASGDSDQQMAEKIGKAKLAANKAAAQKGAGAGGSGGASVSGGHAGGGGAVARSPAEFLPYVLRTLWRLTGEKFTNSKQVAKWVVEHQALIHEKIKELDALEKAQAKR